MSYIDSLGRLSSNGFECGEFEDIKHSIDVGKSDIRVAFNDEVSIHRINGKYEVRTTYAPQVINDHVIDLLQVAISESENLVINDPGTAPADSRGVYSGPLFHCTPARNAVPIIETNSLKGNFFPEVDETEPYICFTTNPDYLFEEGNSEIRFELDSVKLSKDFKLENYKDFSVHMEQYEMRVYTDKIPNLMDYVLNIEIINEGCETIPKALRKNYIFGTEDLLDYEGDDPRLRILVLVNETGKAGSTFNEIYEALANYEVEDIDRVVVKPETKAQATEPEVISDPETHYPEDEPLVGERKVEMLESILIRDGFTLKAKKRDRLVYEKVVNKVVCQITIFTTTDAMRLNFFNDKGVEFRSPVHQWSKSTEDLQNLINICDSYENKPMKVILNYMVAELMYSGSDEYYEVKLNPVKIQNLTKVESYMEEVAKRVDRRVSTTFYIFDTIDEVRAVDAQIPGIDRVEEPTPQQSSYHPDIANVESVTDDKVIVKFTDGIVAEFNVVDGVVTGVIVRKPGKKAQVYGGRKAIPPYYKKLINSGVVNKILNDNHVAEVEQPPITLGNDRVEFEISKVDKNTTRLEAMILDLEHADAIATELIKLDFHDSSSGIWKEVTGPFVGELVWTQRINRYLDAIEDAIPDEPAGVSTEVDTEGVLDHINTAEVVEAKQLADLFRAQGYEVYIGATNNISGMYRNGNYTISIAVEYDNGSLEFGGEQTVDIYVFARGLDVDEEALFLYFEQFGFDEEGQLDMEDVQPTLRGLIDILKENAQRLDDFVDGADDWMDDTEEVVEPIDMEDDNVRFYVSFEGSDVVIEAEILVSNLVKYDLVRDYLVDVLGMDDNFMKRTTTVSAPNRDLWIGRVNSYFEQIQAKIDEYVPPVVDEVRDTVGLVMQDLIKPKGFNIIEVSDDSINAEIEIGNAKITVDMDAYDADIYVAGIKLSDYPDLVTDMDNAGYTNIREYTDDSIKIMESISEEEDTEEFASRISELLDMITNGVANAPKEQDLSQLSVSELIQILKDMGIAKPRGTKASLIKQIEDIRSYAKQADILAGVDIRSNMLKDLTRPDDDDDFEDDTEEYVEPEDRSANQDVKAKFLLMENNMAMRILLDAGFTITRSIYEMTELTKVQDNITCTVEIYGDKQGTDVDEDDLWNDDQLLMGIFKDESGSRVIRDIRASDARQGAQDVLDALAVLVGDSEPEPEEEEEPEIVDDLTDMSIVQLRQLCKEKGLATTGNREALMARIRDLRRLAKQSEIFKDLDIRSKSQKAMNDEPVRTPTRHLDHNRRLLDFAKTALDAEDFECKVSKDGEVTAQCLMTNGGSISLAVSWDDDVLGTVIANYELTDDNWDTFREGSKDGLTEVDLSHLVVKLKDEVTKQIEGSPVDVPEATPQLDDPDEFMRVMSNRKDFVEEKEDFMFKYVESDDNYDFMVQFDDEYDVVYFIVHCADKDDTEFINRVMGNAYKFSGYTGQSIMTVQMDLGDLDKMVDSQVKKFNILVDETLAQSQAKSDHAISAEVVAKPQQDPEQERAAKRLEKFARDVLAPLVDPDPEWNSFFIDTPKEFKKYRLRTVGIMLTCYDMQAGSAKLKASPLFKKMSKARKVVIQRGWQKALDPDGNKCWMCIFIDADYAKDHGKELLEEKVSINGEEFIVKDIRGTDVLLENEDRLKLINLGELLDL